MRDVSTGQPKSWRSRTITLGPDGNLQTETLMFNIGGAGAKTLQMAAAPLPGEENTANNVLTRVVNVGSEPRRILYMEGEPRWEYKFIRQAEEDDRMVQIASIVRTSENKFYRQGIADPKELADGFPSRAEDLFVYQGLIIGSVEAGYFTPGQQELIRQFVDRRGGGLLLLGGQFALADGGWNASNLTDLLPTMLPTQAGTFHREADPKNGTTHTTAELAPAGVDSIITRLVDDPAANAAKWKKLPYLMDYEDPGTPKPGATVLANMITPEGRKLPLLITENFGHGRTAIMATGGSWRWQMSSPLGDTAHDLFWQQLLRWLVSDTPGHVAASVPAQMLLDNGAVTLTAEVRDQQYNPAPDAKVEAHILGPSGVSALVEMTPVPDSPGQFQAAWSAPKPGAYLTEVTAQRADPSTGTVKELGRDVLTFQRMDGVAENFHTEQNRDLLERLAAQTGGQYWKPADLGKLAGRDSFFGGRRDRARDQGSVESAAGLSGAGAAALFRVVAAAEVGHRLKPCCSASSIPPILASISGLDLVAKTVVDGFVAGLHRSPDFGFSQEFAEYRAYTPGDDLRRVDWNVYARTERLYLKRYRGETNSVLTILLDASNSMQFGSHRRQQNGLRPLSLGVAVLPGGARAARRRRADHLRRRDPQLSSGLPRGRASCIVCWPAWNRPRRAPAPISPSPCATSRSSSSAAASC